MNKRKNNIKQVQKKNVTQKINRITTILSKQIKKPISFFKSFTYIIQGIERYQRRQSQQDHDGQRHF